MAMQGTLEKARVLAEALPWISRFRGKTVVVKVGGRAMDDAALRRALAEDLILLSWVGLQLVVVHGGGPQVDAMLERLGIAARFASGLRITDEETLPVVEMVLSGAVGKELVRVIGEEGGKAVGLTGKDGGLVTARRIGTVNGVDLGLVGEVVAVDPTVLRKLGGEFIPVIAPIAMTAEGVTLNVNA